MPFFLFFVYTIYSLSLHSGDLALINLSKTAALSVLRCSDDMMVFFVDYKLFCHHNSVLKKYGSAQLSLLARGSRGIKMGKEGGLDKKGNGRYCGGAVGKEER